MRDRRLERLREQEEKLKAKVKELQERKRLLKEQLEGKLLVAQLIPYFLLPIRNCFINNSNPKTCLKLILLYRCNKGKALRNPVACLENLKAQLLKLKDYTKGYPETTKRIQFAITVLEEILKLPKEEIHRIAEEVRKAPYPERVLRIVEEVLKAGSS